MATKKQTSTSARIDRDKAQAKFNRVNLAYQEDPDDTKKRNAYRKAKTELAEARRVWRLLRVDGSPDGNGDGVANVTSIGTGTVVPKAG
jgi:hypothetical protein